MAEEELRLTMELGPFLDIKVKAEDTKLKLKKLDQLVKEGAIPLELDYFRTYVSATM